MTDLQSLVSPIVPSPPEDDPNFIEDGLNPRQRRFVEEFLVDLDGAKAAIRAGYSAHTASSIATGYLLKHPLILAAIERRKLYRAARVGISQETVINETAALALSRLDHYVIDDQGQVQLAPGAPDDAMAAVQSIKRKVRVHYDKDGNVTGKDYETELKLWDKPNPLKLIGRHVGLFPDRVEHTGKDGGPISITEVRSVIVDPRVEEEKQ